MSKQLPFQEAKICFEKIEKEKNDLIAKNEDLSEKFKLWFNQRMNDAFKVAKDKNIEKQRKMIKENLIKTLKYLKSEKAEKFEEFEELSQILEKECIYLL